MLDTITIAFAATWNLKDDFAVVRKIVRKYTDNEYDYYRERSKDLKLIVSLFDVLGSRIGSLYKRRFDDFSKPMEKILIDGKKYKIRRYRLNELMESIKDKKELIQVLKEEARPVFIEEE